jgi:hypothetical protein
MRGAQKPVVVDATTMNSATHFANAHNSTQASAAHKISRVCSNNSSQTAIYAPILGEAPKTFAALGFVIATQLTPLRPVLERFQPSVPSVIRTPGFVSRNAV